MSSAAINKIKKILNKENFGPLLDNLSMSGLFIDLSIN